MRREGRERERREREDRGRFFFSLFLASLKFLWNFSFYKNSKTNGDGNWTCLGRARHAPAWRKKGRERKKVGLQKRREEKKKEEKRRSGTTIFYLHAQFFLLRGSKFFFFGGKGGEVS